TYQSPQNGRRLLLYHLRACGKEVRDHPPVGYDQHRSARRDPLRRASLLFCALGLLAFTSREAPVPRPLSRAPPGRSGPASDAGGFEYEAPPPVPVDFCALASPAHAVVQPNEVLTARGVVFSTGLTPGAGQGAGLRAQVGYGFPGFDPPTWTWLPAAYTGDVD